MNEAGLTKIREAKRNGLWAKPAVGIEQKEVPAELREALVANKRAKSNFDVLAPSYRRHYIGWIASAKKVDTRLKRAREAVRLLAENRKLGLK
jgi:uncharacterized protein YdeI (YjbR/CyaY-like superfamily)